MSSPSYQHSQSAPVLPILIAVLTVVAFVALTMSDSPLLFDLLMTAVLLVACVAGWSLSKLTVTLDGPELTVAFRYGRPVRRYDVRELVRVEQVRNHWLQGWGVRWISGGTMYNVWGLDAVELEERSGKKFRAGTDEPEALLAAIREARAT